MLRARCVLCVLLRLVVPFACAPCVCAAGHRSDPPRPRRLSVADRSAQAWLEQGQGAHASEPDTTMQEPLLDDDNDAADTAAQRQQQLQQQRHASAAGDVSDPSAAADADAADAPLHLSPSVYLLCLIGFLFSFKPSEPFLTHFLHESKGLSSEQVDDEVYPVWSYAFLACILPVGLASAAFGVRRVVMVGFAARLATRALLLWGQGVFAMQVMQFCFGLASATEALFMALIYRMLPPRNTQIFRTFTGRIQASLLAGHLCAGGLGQYLYDAGYGLQSLFYISAGSVAVASVMFCFIPLRPYGVIPREEGEEEEEQAQPQAAPAAAVRTGGGLSLNDSAPVASPPTPVSAWRESWTDILFARGLRSLALELLVEYRRPGVLLWSAWWAASWCVVELVLNYNTTLFYDRDPNVDNDGTVVASGRGAAAIAALLPAVLMRSAPAGIAAMILVVLWDAVGSVLLFLSASLPSVLSAYLLFIAFYAWMSFLYSLASGALACLVSTPERTGLVFTFNAFVSLVVQVVTQSLMGHQVLKLKGEQKFTVLAWQLAVVAGGFAAATVVLAVNRGRSGGGGKTRHVRMRQLSPGSGGRPVDDDPGGDAEDV